MSFILGSVDSSPIAIRRRQSKASHKGPIVMRAIICNPMPASYFKAAHIMRPSDDEIMRAVRAAECCVSGQSITTKVRLSNIDLWDINDCCKVLNMFHLFPFANFVVTDRVQRFVNKVLVKILLQLLNIIDDYKQSFTFDRMNVPGMVTAIAICMTADVYRPLHLYSIAINVNDLAHSVNEISRSANSKKYIHFLNCIVRYMEIWDNPMLNQIIDDAKKIFDEIA